MQSHCAEEREKHAAMFSMYKHHAASAQIHMCAVHIQ